MRDIQPYQFEPEESWQQEDDSKWLSLDSTHVMSEH